MADHGNVATSVSEPEDSEEHPGPSLSSILDVLKAPTRSSRAITIAKLRTLTIE